MIRHIILRVDEKTHKLLWNQKEERAIHRGENLSWEEFFIDAHNKKVEKK